MEFRLVTAALPYVNNVPHVGHLVGSHLPADIFARYCRLRNYKTLFIGGTDEHGTPTEVTAIKLNTTPEKVTDFFYRIHREIYEWFNISYDNFSRTSRSKIHYKITQEIFLQIFKNGYIIEKEQELPYDPKWNRFLPDRYVEGKCPHCGYEKARGDQCENCGKLLDPKDLIEPRNAITKQPVIFRKTRHLFLDLTRLENKLREWLSKKRGIFTDQAMSMALAWIKEGLKPRSITRDLKWGIPIPYKELWEITREKIFTKLDFTSKEKFIDSLIEALKEIGLVVPGEEIAKIKAIVEQYWPNIGKILSEYNYFEVYKDKVFYVWFDAPIGYLSFTVEKLPIRVNKEDLNDIRNDGIEIEAKGDEMIVKKNNKVLGEVKFEKVENRILLKDIDSSLFRDIEKICKVIMEKISVSEIEFELNWKSFWANPNAKIYHFIGKDNIPFHTIFWPGMLLAFNDSDKIKNEILKDKLNLPYNVIGLNYLNYQGRKISKSQNWGIFCDNIPKAGLDPDYWRFYLSLLIPENKDTDFDWREFLEVINKELINNIGNLIHRVLSFTWKNYKGYINDKPDKKVLEIILKYEVEIRELFEKVKLVQALKKILEFAHLGNQIFQERKPWTDKIKSKSFIKAMLYYVRALAIFLYPFIPESASKILDYLGIHRFTWDDIKNFGEIKVVKEPKPLFRKIREEELKKIIELTTRVKNYEDKIK